MCGIIGISAGNQKKKLSQGLEVIHHRGPDDRGVFSDVSVTLGHARLSIIDLSPTGHQPMGDDKSAIITFNGEVYNYRDLRMELEKRGSVFNGKSDTEVILKGYESEGVSFLSKMRGMWALGVYDVKAKKIILSRDHFGIKPLYYAIEDGELFFASELKALKKILKPLSPNTSKYFQFYNLGYFIGEDTCYQEIKKILPGQVLSWSLEKHAVSMEFLSLVPSQDKEDKGFEESVRVVEEAIRDSIEKHFIADVEVGLLLSGGADSSLIAALSKEINKKPVCYHVSIPGAIDTEYARKVAGHLKLELVEKELSQAFLEQEYNDMSLWLDQPTSDVSIIPTSLVYKAINKVSKVVLSGEGGDELFGGYARHNSLAELSGLKPTLNLAGKLYSPSIFGLKYLNPILSRVEKNISNNLLSTYLASVKTIAFPIDESKIKRDLAEYYNLHPYKAFTSENLFFDQFMYLPHSLMYKNDIASMHSSVEARVPLVDREVLRAASSLSPGYRFSLEYPSKKIIKTILKKRLPGHLVDRPKKGFGFSFDKFDAPFFVEDYKQAAKFHLENKESFAMPSQLSSLLSESKAEIICKKFPRFAFSLVTNHKVFKVS